MNKALAGAIVTVFAGSISLSNANGTVEAVPGQSAVLATAEAPLFLASPQDKQEELLKRLEKLAALVAQLEAEVAQKEKLNAQLKAQLSSNGAAWTINGQPAVRAFSSTPGASVIIESDGVRIQTEGVRIEKKADPNKEK